MHKALMLLVLAFGLVGCNEDGNNKNQIIQSYHMQCAGSQSFTASSEEGICESLVNEYKNLDCDRDFRKMLFNQLCPGQNFPHKITNPRRNVSNHQYEFQENGCNTGRHYFYFSSNRAMAKSLCAVLENDELNNYCAENSRREKFNRECL